MKSRKQAFSLIELAVVVLLIGLVTIVAVNGKSLLIKANCVASSFGTKTITDNLDNASALTTNKNTTYETCVNNALGIATVISTNPGTCSGSPCTSCKTLLAANPGIASGTYNIDPTGSSPFQVYCDMTTDSGGWTLVSNVPPSPNGHWEYNASNYGTTTYPATPLTTNFLITPTNIDNKFLASNYSDVLFLDTGKNNWFIVPKTSKFYLNNYKGTCSDSQIISGANFSVTKTSTNGLTSLFASWDSGCPNGTDTVCTNNGCCTTIFVNFDQYCSPNMTNTKIRTFIR